MPSSVSEPCPPTKMPPPHPKPPVPPVPLDASPPLPPFATLPEISPPWMDRAAPVVWTAPPMPKGPKNGEKDDVPVPGLPRAWLPMKEVLVTEAGVSESAARRLRFRC